MKVLNIPKCMNLNDSYSPMAPHSVHSWLIKAAPNVNCSSNVYYVNASFTFRHSLRYSCYKSLVERANTQTNSIFLATSFHISFFIPRYHPKKSPSNIVWFVMEPTYPHVPQFVIPYVVTRKDFIGMHFVPWDKRALILIAGHIPKSKFSLVRANVAKALGNVSDATVSVSKNSLSKNNYTKAVFTHKFCVVAQGDTGATKKVAEIMVVGANGGCIPLFVHGVVKPYAPYFYTHSTLEVSRVDSSTVSFLRKINETRYSSMVSKLKPFKKFFLQPTASEEALSQACKRFLH